MEPQPDGHEWELATEVLGTESSRFTLLIAPGRRYREQGEGYLSGCDGERSWLAVPDDGGWSVEATAAPSRRRRRGCSGRRGCSPASPWNPADRRP